MKKISLLVIVFLVASFLIISKPAHATVEKLTRVSGGDRILTAVEISKATFFNPLGDLYFYNSNSPADALAAVPWAATGAYNGPLLPVKDGTSLTQEVINEINRLKFPAGTTAHILGGKNAISTAVEQQLQDLGLNADRINGKNRFETAAKIAEKMRGFGIPNLYIVNGYAVPDALAVAPWAARDVGAILFTYDDATPPETLAAIDAQAGGILYIVGGSGVISKSQEEALTLRHWGQPGVGTVRFDGRNRNHTARIIGDLFTPTDSLYSTGYGLANGITMVDALPAGVLLAQQGMPLLLAQKDTLTCDTADFIADYPTQFFTGFVFGGTSVISDQTKEDAEGLMETSKSLGDVGC
jgi:5'-nucleotidase/UDP-sugar diphosphatase